MAAAGQVAHHRGARNKVVFFPEDIKALKQATRKVPAKKKPEPYLAAVTALVVAGYNGGAWNGAGIVSSTAGPSASTSRWKCRSGISTRTS